MTKLPFINTPGDKVLGLNSINDNNMSLKYMYNSRFGNVSDSSHFYGNNNKRRIFRKKKEGSGFGFW